MAKQVKKVTKKTVEKVEEKVEKVEKIEEKGIADRLAEGFAELEAKTIAHNLKVEGLKTEREGFERERIEANMALDRRAEQIAKDKLDLDYDRVKLDEVRGQIASEKRFNTLRLDEAKKKEAQAVKEIKDAKNASIELRQLKDKNSRIEDSIIVKEISLREYKSEVDKKVAELQDLEVKSAELDAKAEELEKQSVVIDAEKAKLKAIKEEAKSIRDNLTVKEAELSAYENALNDRDRDIANREKRFNKSVKSK